MNNLDEKVDKLASRIQEALCDGTRHAMHISATSQLSKYQLLQATKSWSAVLFRPTRRCVAIGKAGRNQEPSAAEAEATI